LVDPQLVVSRARHAGNSKPNSKYANILTSTNYTTWETNAPQHCKHRLHRYIIIYITYTAINNIIPTTAALIFSASSIHNWLAT